MDKTWDLVIIGGGPAGLSAAQYGARANLKTLLLEEMACGGQSLVIDRLENYPGIGEPVSGFEFADRMQAQAAGFGAVVETASVTSVTKDGDRFIIHSDAGTLEAGAVILATGAAHRHLGVPGEEAFAGKGVSYCATCDGPFFKGQSILVVGGGDSACDEATFLSKLSDKVTMVHRRDRFRAQAAVAERVLSNPHISVRWNSVVKEIKGDSKVRSVILMDVNTGEESELAVEAVFIFIGSDPRNTLAKGAKLDEEGFVVTDQRMESSVKGFFVAGDLRATPFRQVVVAAGEGAVAAHCAAQYLDECACHLSKEAVAAV